MELKSLYPVAKDLFIGMADGTPTDLCFKLVGFDSTPFRAIVKKHTQLNMGVEQVPIEEVERQNAELLAACIIGWTGLSDGGAEVPYTPEKAIELMLTPELSFVREQVERYVAQRVNFFRRPTTEAV